jgi:hypothetical protein
MRIYLTFLVLVGCGSQGVVDGGASDSGGRDAGAADDATAREDGGRHGDAGGPDGGHELCVLVGPASTATRPPGVVIFRVDPTGTRFVGSPSLVRVPSGALIASNDLFGEGQRETPPTFIHRSDDDGGSWSQIAQMDGQFWSSLFVHRGALYLMGTSAEYGQIVIRRSDDEGRTWTTPTDSANGQLSADAPYHTAPTPVLEFAGRLWRGIEWVREPINWPRSFEASMFWADADTDLLRADSWRATAHHSFPSEDSGIGWLEGNPVVTPDGQLVNMLRVHLRDETERAAILAIRQPETEPVLDPSPEFVPLNGASKKFHVGFDEVTGRYMTLVNIVDGVPSAPAAVRNRLALASSTDLRSWDYHVVLLANEDATRHGFQYASWIIEGDDLLFVSRTAHDDELGGAPNFHDANFLTFHRLRRFRGCLERSL